MAYTQKKRDFGQQSAKKYLTNRFLFVIVYT